MAGENIKASFSNIYTYSIYVKKYSYKEVGTNFIPVVEKEQYSLYSEMTKNENKVVQNMKKLALKNLSHSQKFLELTSNINFSGRASKKIEMKPEVFLSLWIMLSCSHLFRGEKNNVARLMSMYVPINTDNKEYNYKEYSLVKLKNMKKIAPKELTEKEERILENLNAYLIDIIEDFVSKPEHLLDVFKGLNSFIKQGKEKSGPLVYIDKLGERVTNLTEMDELKKGGNKVDANLFHDELTTKIKSGWFSNQDVIGNLKIIFTEIFLLPNETEYCELYNNLRNEVSSLLSKIDEDFSIEKYKVHSNVEQNRIYEAMRQLQLTLEKIKWN